VPIDSRSSAPLRWRRVGDALLFGVTAIELSILIVLTPAFTFIDWIYLSQHLIVLALAFARRAPSARDDSPRSAVAVVVAYAYPYAQIAYLSSTPGQPVSYTAGLVVVTIAACVSLASLASLGTSFGIRPALRELVTHGPYRVVRHPIYLAYVLSDIGYNLQEWNPGSVLLVLIGWVALLYRIRAEEHLLRRDERWSTYASTVRYRLLPWVW
jgi:protein-S-isoprenylcysteine O-methyltransferase Ste14